MRVWPRRHEELKNGCSNRDECTRQTRRRPGTAASFGLLARVLLACVALDLITKLMIRRNFYQYDQVNLIGDYVRITYIHNPGAAFGINLGPYSRSIFLGLSVVALVALGGMYWVTPARDRLRLLAISLICAAPSATCSTASARTMVWSTSSTWAFASCAGPSSTWPT